MAAIQALPQHAAPHPALRRRPLTRWRRNASLLIGGGVILAIAALALAAPLIAPYSPFAQDLAIRLKPPVFLDEGTWAHLLGTDQLGRDYLTRMIYGARISLLIGLGTVAASGLFGTTLGLLAGYYGGRVDQAVMFIVTGRLALPLVLVALAVVGLVSSRLGPAAAGRAGPRLARR